MDEEDDDEEEGDEGLDEDKDESTAMLSKWKKQNKGRRQEGRQHGQVLLQMIYRISSPISLAIFSVSDTEIFEIFHQKRGSAYSRGFGITENC